MNDLIKPTIRLRLDVLNPGHFLACCGVLELTDRAWNGAEGWFESGSEFFCVAPIDAVPEFEHTANGFLQLLNNAELRNTLMHRAQLDRLDALTALRKSAGKRGKLKDAGDVDGTAEAPETELAALEAQWATAKEAAILLGEPFNLRLDWYLDDVTGAGRFKTWAGQQNITEIAFGLKDAVRAGNFGEAEQDWLFVRVPCEKSLHFDAVADGSDLDIGFSFDPLQVHTPLKRPLVQFLALVGLQRFAPRQAEGQRTYVYTAWRDPLAPQAAQAAARGLGSGSAPTFEFRLLFRSKYLKSFLPAQLRR